ncbi:MAG: vWA domain-containing protein [Promethearchaeia archaeon]
MNLANVPLLDKDEDYIRYIQAIAMHEVSHYEIIPYDGLTHARLLRAAMKHVNRYHAPIVVNVFADLMIDKILHDKYSEMMEWELKKTYQHVIEQEGNNISKFFLFMIRAYEKLWDTEIRQEKDDDTIIKTLVNKITAIILKDFEDETKWELKVSKIAYHLKNLMSDTFNIIGFGVKCKDGNRAKKSGDGRVRIEVPEDVLEIMGNPLESKNRDKINEENDEEKQRKAEQFASETPFSEFGAPASEAGILIEGDALATWYRGLAKNLIEIKIYEEKPGGQIPIYIEPWRIGEPLEDLDIVQTLLTCPVIIPNITTRKWRYDHGPGIAVEKQIPDLLLVLDSSGSMFWNFNAKRENARGEYHIALVASFAALHYAASRGVKFSVINFSNIPYICEWTTDYEMAEKILLKYQGGGTNLPTKAIQSQVNKADGKVLVILITDFGIYNWGSSVKTLINLAERGHKIVGFFIGSDKIPRDRFKKLLDKVSFYPVKKIEDLINLVIEEVKKNYDLAF